MGKQSLVAVFLSLACGLFTTRRLENITQRFNAVTESQTAHLLSPWPRAGFRGAWAPLSAKLEQTVQTRRCEGHPDQVLQA